MFKYSKSTQQRIQTPGFGTHSYDPTFMERLGAQLDVTLSENEFFNKTTRSTRDLMAQEQAEFLRSQGITVPDDEAEQEKLFEENGLLFGSDLFQAARDKNLAERKTTREEGLQVIDRSNYEWKWSDPAVIVGGLVGGMADPVNAAAMIATSTFTFGGSIFLRAGAEALINMGTEATQLYFTPEETLKGLGITPEEQYDRWTTGILTAGLLGGTVGGAVGAASKGMAVRNIRNIEQGLATAKTGELGFRTEKFLNDLVKGRPEAIQLLDNLTTRANPAIRDEVALLQHVRSLGEHDIKTNGDMISTMRAAIIVQQLKDDLITGRPIEQSIFHPTNPTRDKVVELFTRKRWQPETETPKAKPLPEPTNAVEYAFQGKFTDREVAHLVYDINKSLSKFDVSIRELDDILNTTAKQQTIDKGYQALERSGVNIVELKQQIAKEYEDVIKVNESKKQQLPKEVADYIAAWKRYKRNTTNTENLTKAQALFDAIPQDQKTVFLKEGALPGLKTDYETIAAPTFESARIKEHIQNLKNSYKATEKDIINKWLVNVRSNHPAESLTENFTKADFDMVDQIEKSLLGKRPSVFDRVENYDNLINHMGFAKSDITQAIKDKVHNGKTLGETIRDNLNRIGDEQLKVASATGEVDPKTPIIQEISYKNFNLEYVRERLSEIKSQDKVQAWLKGYDLEGLRSFDRNERINAIQIKRERERLFDKTMEDINLVLDDNLDVRFDIQDKINRIINGDVNELQNIRQELYNEIEALKKEIQEIEASEVSLSLTEQQARIEQARIEQAIKESEFVDFDMIDEDMAIELMSSVDYDKVGRTINRQDILSQINERKNKTNSNPKTELTKQLEEKTALVEVIEGKTKQSKQVISALDKVKAKVINSNTTGIDDIVSKEITLDDAKAAGFKTIKSFETFLAKEQERINKSVGWKTEAKDLYKQPKLSKDEQAELIMKNVHTKDATKEIVDLKAIEDAKLKQAELDKIADEFENPYEKGTYQYAMAEIMRENIRKGKGEVILGDDKVLQTDKRRKEFKLKTPAQERLLTNPVKRERYMRQKEEYLAKLQRAEMAKIREEADRTINNAVEKLQTTERKLETDINNGVKKLEELTPVTEQPLNTSDLVVETADYQDIHILRTNVEDLRLKLKDEIEPEDITDHAGFTQLRAMEKQLQELEELKIIETGGCVIL